MKNIICLFIFVFLFLIPAKSQSYNSERKWLVILSSFGNKTDAEKYAAKFTFSTTIIESADYENLVRGFFLVVIPLDSRDEAIAKSEELKTQKIKNYIKYSGYLLTENEDFRDKIKLVNSNYIFLKESSSGVYDSLKSKLVSSGTPVDVLTEISVDELPKGCLDWKNRKLYGYSGDNKLSNDVKITGFYILSRIQIETYRPPWCFEREDYGECMTGNYTEDEVIKYVTSHGMHYIVATYEGSADYFVVSDSTLLPETFDSFDTENIIGKDEDFIKSLPQSDDMQREFETETPESDKEKGVDFWLNSSYAEYKFRTFTLGSDSIIVLSVILADSPCGGVISTGFTESWMIENGKLVDMKYSEPEIDCDFMLKFPVEDGIYYLKMNHNTTHLIPLQSNESFVLPWQFEDPWEC